MDPGNTETRLVRVYRRLTALYPAPFREEYETELVQVVEDRESDARGLPGVLLLFAELVADILTTAPKEHYYMLRQDLRHATRVIRNNPAVTLTAILVLGIGIGATTTVFSIVNAVLLRPLPFPNADRLVVIEEASSAQGIDRMGPGFPDVLDYQRQAKSLESLGAFITGGFSLTGQGEPERVEGAWVSANLFDTLGINPILGRQFTREEDLPKVGTAVMLSYGLWQRRFGGDRAIVGRTMQVNGKARTIVGVMPQGFRFPETADVWGTLSLDPAENTRTDHFLSVIGRVRDGVPVSQAEGELQTILHDIQRKYPDSTGDLSVHATPIRDRLAGEYRPALIRVLAAVGFVLAITCANIMNLLLARAAGRVREIAIRTALGANRRRIMRQVLTESALLGAIGGGLGLAVSILGVKALTRFAPVEIPYWVQLDLDSRVLAFAVAVTVGSVLLFGLAPAFRSAGIDPAGSLSEVRRGVTSGVGVGRLRQGLVSAQVALSVILLVGAGLMIRSFLNLQRVDLGFNTNDVLTFRISLPNTRYQNPQQRAAFLAEMRRRLAVLPGVMNVATTTGLPMESGWWRTVQRDGETKTRPGELPLVYYTMTSPGYFRALGIPLKQGRDFSESDSPSAPVIIISEKLAKQYWPHGNAIGSRVRIDPFLPGASWRTIIGVAGDVLARGPREPAPAAAYVPEIDDARPVVSVVLRSQTPMLTQTQAARKVIRALDAELPLYAIGPAAHILSERTWQFRFYTFLFTVFGGIAILLVTVGLSGIMAHVVIERTHEIGLRIAIGATARDVVTMILSQSLLLAGVGAAAGLIGALVITRALTNQLFGVQPHDVTTIVSVLCALLAATLLAAWIPARRAANIDPACSLRSE